MNVSIIVATFGSIEWANRGNLTADAARSYGTYSVINTHLDDGTLAEARNLSAKGADADWLCFLDAGDELEPGYLVAMWKTMRHWNLARRGDLRDNPLLLVPALRRVHHAANGQTHREPPVIPDWERLLIDLNCAVIGTLVPRQLFLQVGGFRDWPIYEDWDLWLRCVRAGARMVPVPDAVYCAHVEDGSRNVGDRDVANRTYALIRAEHDDVEPGWWRDRKVSPL